MRRNWLKSALLIVLCLCLVLALAACGGKKKGSSDGGDISGGPGTKPPSSDTSCSHVPGLAVRENEMPGGCESPTTYDEVTRCVTCGAELSRVQRSISPLGHVYNDTGYCINCSAQWPASAGLTFSSNGDGTCRLTSIGECTDTNIVIPYTSPWGDKVVSIDSSVFYFHTEIRSVTIPPVVEYIGESAFYCCLGLTEINIPDSVTEISESAFSGCAALKSVNIGAGVTSIGELAFYNCPSLENITVSEDNSAYKNIDGNHIYTSDGTTLVQYAIGNGATSFVVPEGVTTISNDAFHGSKKLVSVVISDSVETIESQAFNSCTSLVSVTLGTGLASVGSYAFGDCYKLVEVVNNSELYISTGSSSYGYVGYYASNVHSGESNITNVDGYLFYTHSGVNYLLGYAGSDTVLTLPDKYGDENYQIYPYAFYARDDIFGVTLGSGVTVIGENAFAYCHNISSIVIPDSVSYIGSYAFYENSSLASVTLGTGLASVGSYAFEYCHKLVEVVNNSELYISAGSSSYGYVGYYALDVHSGESNITNVDGYLFYTHSGVNYLLGYAGSDTVLTLPDKYGDENYQIYPYAFYADTHITSLTIGAGVEYIGGKAFYGCMSLEEIYFNATSMSDLDSYNRVFSYAGQNTDGITVTIGAGVTRVPAYLFCPEGGSYVPNIVSVEFAEGSVCESIGTYAFYNCDSIESIEIPENITSIGSYAFGYCDGIEEIYFNATSLGVMYSYNYVFSNAGQNADGITVTVGANVTMIPSYLFCPEGSSYTPNIVSVEFAEGSVCESIGTYAFYNCDSIESIEIPENITSIGSYAFGSCDGIEEIYFNATEMSDFSSYYNYAFSYAGQSAGGITVTVGANVRKIPAYLFCPDGGSYVPYIARLEFEDGSVCESIGTYAFYNCSGLESIEIPENITSIGNYAFYNCTGIEEIHFNATSMSDLGSSNYVLAHAGQNADGITVVFGDNVTKVPAYLFCPSDSSYRPKVVSAQFGEDSACESIGGSAFYYCQDLEEINIPDDVVSIGALAFYGCADLIVVNIPSGVQSIGDSAFKYCSAMECVVIPLSVEYVGSYAFEYCDSLTIYCEADSALSGWSSSWNNSSRPVVYGYGSEEYTYTFITNGAEDIDPIVSAAFITLPEPTREDYVFFGWYDNEELYGTAVSTVYYSKENHTLYAKWVHVSDLLDGSSFERAYTKAADGIGTLVTIDDAGETVYFKLTATTSKTYYFYSSGDYDSYLTVYNSSYSYISSNDDGGSGNNFSLSQYVSAGETIYLGVRMWSSGTTGSFYFYAE